MSFIVKKEKKERKSLISHLSKLECYSYYCIRISNESNVL